jgi:5-dehydro-4-deoxyglucarate dehydratase
VRSRNHEAIHAGLRDFVMPLIGIRNRRKGYAVAIIKAGMKIVGRDSGPVRSPLTDLTDQDMADLETLVGKMKTVSR